MAETTDPRLAKGINIVELVKALRVAQRARKIRFPSAAAEALVAERVSMLVWYPHATFVELLQVAYEHLLGRKEENAYQMGLLGGMKQLTGVHKLYLTPDDPVASLVAMRHAWRALFNFGTLTAEPESATRVLFTLSGYQDITPVHAAMIVGWGAAAGQLTAAPHAHGEMIERPWQGAPHLRYLVHF